MHKIAISDGIIAQVKAQRGVAAAVAGTDFQ
jgi:hypothetical protein